MDTSALEKYAASARTALRQGVQNRLYLLGLTSQNLAPVDADAVDGRLLSTVEKDQRRRLMERVEALGDGDYSAGYEPFVECAASTWFNRLAALRYMEVHDFLSSHTRVLSAPDGSFAPQCLKEADSLGLPGLPPERAFALMAAHNDEALLRAVIVAQCEQLAEALPQVFGGAADDEPVLPDGLLRAEGPVAGLVVDLPDGLWADVEVLGWLYQFYIAERKDEVFAGFKKGKKAGPAELGPATQLFTPDWIVDYMVQNSLGRLWMLNNPDSPLVEKMPYYIAPEGDPGEFLKVSSPEEITVCDPACGSGHILVAAFRLLAEMYLERGYRPSDVPGFILTKNLAGLEVDPRAAQFAELQLAMVAREYDRRFLNRGVRPDVCVLRPVEFEDSELPAGCALEKNKALFDALAHLDQCGSLLAPTEGDLADLRQALAACPDDLAGVHTGEKLEEALASCEALARGFDCVIANPPYMGSSNFDKWTSAWVKKNYPDTKSDLCTCFIERGFILAVPGGYNTMVTMQSWMFLGSYEKMREKLLANESIVSMCHLGARAFDAIGGEVVATVATVFENGKSDVKGSYIRLVDIIGSEPKREAALEAIQNPACGWFYRADATTFKDIPGTPIAYWTSEAMRRAFREGESISSYSDYTGSQNKTGDNDRFLRFCWEVSASSCGMGKTWLLYSKGGDFRKWFGNNSYVVRWDRMSRDYYKSNQTSNLLSEQYWSKPGITYTMLTSGLPGFRFFPGGSFDMAGPVICNITPNITTWLAFFNSSIVAKMLSMLNPTLNLQARDVKSLPCLLEKMDIILLSDISSQCIEISEMDWNSSEFSSEFKMNPLISK